MSRRVVVGDRIRWCDRDGKDAWLIGAVISTGISVVVPGETMLVVKVEKGGGDWEFLVGMEVNVVPADNPSGFSLVKGQQ